MSTSTSLTRWEPVAHAVLRIVAGLIFLEHGTQKFLGFHAGDMAGAGGAFDNMGGHGGGVQNAAGALVAVGPVQGPAAFRAPGQQGGSVRREGGVWGKGGVRLGNISGAGIHAKKQK